MSPAEKASRISIAGKTEHRPSQYRHALQSVNWRFASSMSCSSMRRLASCDPSEDAADREADPGEVPARQDVPRHHLARGEDVLERCGPATLDAAARVDLDAGVGEGEARPKRVCGE